MLALIKERLTTYTPRIIESPTHTWAGVLIPIFEKDGDICIVLTKRTDTVRIHKGEVSFPGGVYEEKDGTTLETALRECGEEIGVQRKDIEIIGRIDDLYTLTGYVITPYVGIIPFPYPFKTNPQEVAYLIHLPFTFLKNTQPLIEEAEYRGRLEKVPSLHYNGDRIWGATCRILLTLQRIIDHGQV